LLGSIEKNFIKIIEGHDKAEVAYEDLFKTLYYNSLLKRAYDLYPDLTTFDGAKLDQLRNKFKIHDRSLTELKKTILYNNLSTDRITPGINHGQTKKCTEKALLERITSQKAPRIKLRELIKKSSYAIYKKVGDYKMRQYLTLTSNYAITLEKLITVLNRKNVKQIKVATVLLKPDSYKKEFPIDYFGMKIPNDFVVGYGLDYDGQGRNLKEIYVLA
jgi:hypothetical protein